jgi:hypothetical protein
VFEEVDISMGTKAKVMVNMFAPEYNRDVSAICVLKKSKGKKTSFNRAASKVTIAQGPQQKAPQKPSV